MLMLLKIDMFFFAEMFKICSVSVLGKNHRNRKFLGQQHVSISIFKPFYFIRNDLKKGL